MAKKKTEKKVREIKTPGEAIIQLRARVDALEQRSLISPNQLLKKVNALEQRIDRIVNALDKSKSVRGL